MALMSMLRPSLRLPLCGGDKRARTADFLLAKQALSQLSYTPSKLDNVTSLYVHP